MNISTFYLNYQNARNISKFFKNQSLKLYFQGALGDDCRCTDIQYTYIERSQRLNNIYYL